jgi:uncharacterized protein YxjI
MKIVLLLFLMISFNLIACDNFPMYSKIRLKERYFSIGTNVGMYVDGEEIAVIEEKLLSLTTKIVLKQKNKVIAQAEKKLFSFGSKTEITDCNGKLIGTIEEQILKGLISLSSQYNLYDENHVFLANSEMSHILSTSLIVKGKNGELKAVRDRINWLSDNWTITQVGGLDQRLVLFIPVMKTLSDNKARKKKK